VNNLIDAVLPPEQNEGHVQGSTIDILNEDDDIHTSTACDEVYSCSLENKVEVGEVDIFRELFQGIKEKFMPLSSFANSKELIKLKSYLLKYQTIAGKSLTAKLWLQYNEYVENSKLFI